MRTLTEALEPWLVGMAASEEREVRLQISEAWPTEEQAGLLWGCGGLTQKVFVEGPGGSFPLSGSV